MGRRPRETQRPTAFRPHVRPDNYYRYDAHGYGPVLLAGADITQLLKQHPYGITDSLVQIVK